MTDPGSAQETAGFVIWLVFRLAGRPIWLLGVGSMIGGYPVDRGRVAGGLVAKYQEAVRA